MTNVDPIKLVEQCLEPVRTHERLRHIGHCADYDTVATVVVLMTQNGLSASQICDAFGVERL